MLLTNWTCLPGPCPEGIGLPGAQERRLRLHNPPKYAVAILVAFHKVVVLLALQCYEFHPVTKHLARVNTLIVSAVDSLADNIRADGFDDAVVSSLLYFGAGNACWSDAARDAIARMLMMVWEEATFMSNLRALRKYAKTSPK